MPYRIQIARPATLDALEYAAYIRDQHQSSDAASRWLDGLYDAIGQLDETPNRYSVISEADELGFAYRSFMYHSHRVVYAVHEAEKRVIIHRIYHGARRSLTNKELQ